MNIFALIAATVIGVFVIAEILVAYQKFQMKKQFLQELDKEERDDTARLQ